MARRKNSPVLNAATAEEALQAFASMATASTEEAAFVLGLSPDTLLRAAQAGTTTFPSIRISSITRWPTKPIVRALLGEVAVNPG